MIVALVIFVIVSVLAYVFTGDSDNKDNTFKGLGVLIREIIKSIF